MWKEIFRFEIRYHLSQPLFYLSASVFFLCALLLASTGASAVLSDVPGTANRNAPFVIVKMLSFLSILGLFVITAFVSSSALRDFEQGTHMLFFTKPVRKFEYLTGRFAGSMLASLALFFITALGIVVGNFAPWQDVERVGSFALTPYLFGLLVMVLPNLLIMGAIFFAVAIWSRRQLVTYLCVVLFWILQDAVEVLVSDFENRSLGDLLEPTGLAALETATRYWTVAEYNAALPELAGALAGNRLLWVGISLLILGWSYTRFSYSRAVGGRSTKTPTPATPPIERPSPPTWAHFPRPAQRFSANTAWRQLIGQTRMETASVFKSTPFIIFLALGLVLVITMAWFIGHERGTPAYPVTHLMLKAIQVGLGVFLLIVVTFYGGELVWRERTLKLAGVYDALPAPDGVFLGAKILTLILMVATFILAGILTTIVVQLLSGFFDLELGLYIKASLVIVLFYVLFGIASVFIQVVTPAKFIGFLLMIVFLITTIFLPRVGFEHMLYRYAGTPFMPYSDMNGFGHFLPPFLWSKLYWGFAAAILLGLSIVFWRRGIEVSIGSRLATARARGRGPIQVLLAISAVGFLTTGSVIYYNTNIVNRYLPKSRQEKLRAEYEKKYRQYTDIPQLRITDVYADVDIFPRDRRVEIRGSYRLENKTTVPIATVHVSIDPNIVIDTLDPGKEHIVVADPELGYYIYDLADPMEPGEVTSLTFGLRLENRGFVNNNPDNSVVRNGTFLNNRQCFPALGYQAWLELVDRNKRRKHGLPPVPRMAEVDDLFARRNNYVTTDADWIRFETTVSTGPDQIAIAPGYLQREWEKEGRRYFHYKMDSPILNFYSYVSGDYAVRRDRWEDVAIEIYYHESHDYNIDRMIEAVKTSLDYFTTNFGPYQHRQVRIIEFPCYRTFAQSFPNTIPFSEAAGFIARMDDEEHVDYLFCRTAHEVAHQWWAHQVIGGDVQGATLLSESLAEYSALMVMEKTFGPKKLRHMLKYELDEYLHGRGSEPVEEMPLMLVEDQKYIHYNKGCLVMYALRDYIGEENLNRALARYVEQVAFQEPPYTNSHELLACLREVIPDSLAYVLEDMFETVTLFSNRVEAANYTRLNDGRYLVNLVVEARKLRADGLGVETEIQINDWIDVGVFGEEEIEGESEEKVLYMEKRRISEPRMSFDTIVEGRPVRAGIDPYNKLIDRDSDDNVKRVQER